MAQARAFRARSPLREPTGLAHLIACSNYRRLIRAEPLLRRSVPLLILAFIASLGLAVFVRLAGERLDLIEAAKWETTVLASALAADVARLDPGTQPGPLADAAQAHLDRTVPRRALNDGRVIAIVDARGIVVASTREALARRGAAITSVLTDADLATSTAQARQVALVSGAPAVVAAKPLPLPYGGLVLVHEITDILAIWRGQATMTVSLFLTTAFVVLLLGFAFHWQAIRAREADDIYEQASARIETALTRGRCGLWDWNFASDRIYWSASMFDILGYEPRDGVLSFSDIAVLLHPSDVDLLEAARTMIATSAVHVDREFRLRAADQRWIWIRARGEIVQTEQGPHLIGIAVDVTEQKALAARSAEADLRLRDAIESISEAFVLWDADNRLVMCNSKFQQLHGLPDEAVRSGVPYDRVLAAGKQPVITRRVCGEGSAESGAFTFEAQLEDGRWLNISERRTKDGGFVSVGTDITSLKRHESQLLENDQQLRGMVEDLSRSQAALELKAHELAVMAQKYSEEKTRAEAASRAKSEFMANMSHELRTPLNAIIGFSDMMQQGTFGPLGHDKYREYCSDICESGRHLLDVINDILDMARLEAGRIELNLELVDLDSLINDAIRLVSGRADEKLIVIEHTSTAGLQLHADRRAIKQIALNLLSNAVKFTPKGGKVRVQGRLVDGDVQLCIEDTGIGIPKDMIARLAKPFVQVENQYTKHHKGSGLGLAISRSLAELHGGSLRISSNDGQGTAVILRFPRGSVHRTTMNIPRRLERAAPSKA
jgi:two-component system cell cycle sensor histidine kinase PleC